MTSIEMRPSPIEAGMAPASKKSRPAPGRPAPWPRKDGRGDGDRLATVVLTTGVRSTPSGPSTTRASFPLPDESQHGVGQGRPGLLGPRAPGLAAEAHAGHARVRIDPEERPGPAVVPEGGGGVGGARPVGVL